MRMDVQFSPRYETYLTHRDGMIFFPLYNYKFYMKGYLLKNDYRAIL